jgi:hypothetical protein
LSRSGVIKKPRSVAGFILKSSVADPGCLFRIPDPKTATKDRGEKKFVVIPFCSHKFYKIENYFIFEMPIFKEL